MLPPYVLEKKPYVWPRLDFWHTLFPNALLSYFVKMLLHAWMEFIVAQWWHIINQSGTKPNLVAKILATKIGNLWA